MQDSEQEVLPLERAPLGVWKKVECNRKHVGCGEQPKPAKGKQLQKANLAVAKVESICAENSANVG